MYFVIIGLSYDDSGRISPNYHINSLINDSIEKIDFWVYPMENNNEISKTEVELIGKYQPKWNIALK